MMGLAVAFVLARVPVLAAQVPVPARTDESLRALRLFLACEAKPACDFDYLRGEIIWVHYVRDPAEAQVQVVSTSQATGSGGAEVTMKFIGRGEFAGLDDEIRHTTTQGATLDEQRREFARVLKLGLARYLLRTPSAGDFALSHVPRPQADVDALVTALERARDPWDFWVFNVSVEAWASGESQSSSSEVSGSVTASRTTPAWKLRMGATGSNNHNSYRLSDSSEYVSNTRSHSASALLAASLGKHFAAGATSNLLSSTRQNIDLRFRTAAVFEYDAFPYDQYAQRHLVLSYSVGFNSYQYADTTIYNKVEERLLDQSYSLWFAATEPWGKPYIGVEGSNFLSDFQKNRLSAYGGISIRIARGLQFSVNGAYSRVRDQLNLAKEGATDAEILLQIRELKTSYTYSGFISLGYTFGSLFNNVVNPRLGGGGATKP